MAELGFGTGLPASRAQLSPLCPECAQARGWKAGESKESSPLCPGEREKKRKKRRGGEVGADQTSLGWGEQVFLLGGAGERVGRRGIPMGVACHRQ